MVFVDWLEITFQVWNISVTEFPFNNNRFEKVALLCWRLILWTESGPGYCHAVLTWRQTNRSERNKKKQQKKKRPTKPTVVLPIQEILTTSQRTHFYVLVKTTFAHHSAACLWKHLEKKNIFLDNRSREFKYKLCLQQAYLQTGPVVAQNHQCWVLFLMKTCV